MRALVVVALAGCYSFPTMGRARTVEPGRVQLWGVPEALIVATPGGEGQEAGASVRPMVEAGARYGATERIELDAHVGTFGIAAGTRVQLARSPDPEVGVDLLIAPALVFTLLNKPAIELPVLAGWNVGRHQLVASGRVVYQQHWGVGGVSGPLHFGYVGGSLGFAWQLSDHLTLMPEIAVLSEFAAPAGFASELPNAIAIQTGIGVLWDL